MLCQAIQALIPRVPFKYKKKKTFNKLIGKFASILLDVNPSTVIHVILLSASVKWAYDQISWKNLLYLIHNPTEQGSVFSLYTKSITMWLPLMASVKLTILFKQYSIDLLFSPFDNEVPSQITAFLAIISAWMSAHHLKLKWSKTKLLFLQAKKHPCHFNRHLHHLTHTKSQEPWCHTGQWAVNCNLHTNIRHIMQIPPAKHLPDCGIGPNLLSVQLLQLTPGQPPSVCNQTSAAHAECCRAADIQPSQVLPCHISAAPLPWLPIPA